MFDLHTHILPGIDDGPATLKESVRLARRMVEDGVHTVVATPHLRADYPRVVPDELCARCRELASRLRDVGVPLTVLPGGELDVAWALHADDEQLRLVTYGQRGAFILLETPYGPLPYHFERIVYELRLRGYRAVLAHPERNPSFQADPRRLEALVDDGVLVQVTSMALASRNRRSRSRRLAERLVERGMAHVLATDAHSPEDTARAPLSKGVAVAARIDPARAESMVREAPAAVLAAVPGVQSPP